MTHPTIRTMTTSESGAESARQFTTEIEIAAERDAVWSALTDDVELRRWFPPECSVEPGVGGTISWSWRDLHSWPQTIEIWEPGSRLRTRYDSGVDDGHGGKHPLFLEFQLEGEGGRTTLRLVQSGFGTDAAFDQEFDGIAKGWPVELCSLRLYLEAHAGLDRQLAWCTAEIGVSPDEAWERLTGSAGFHCDPRIDELGEGDAFRLETADGDRFEGRALSCFPHEFSGVDENHGGAFFRLLIDDCGGEDRAWLWLATYGRPEGEAAELAARWESLLERLFPASGETAGAAGA